MRIGPPSSREDSILRGGIFESRRLKYAALDFIPRFFERCEGVDSKHVRSCLEDYLATFHPDGPAARKAIECIDGIRHATFRDADVPGMVETLVAGIVPGREPRLVVRRLSRRPACRQRHCGGIC